MTKKRIETGPIRFGDDWPGVFIRGDTAFMFASELGNLLQKLPKPGPDADLAEAITYKVVEGLQQLLESCFVKPGDTGFIPEKGDRGPVYPEKLTNIVRWTQLPSEPKK